MVKPGFGFPTHPHRDMEIISYVVDGELTHADSMGNKHTLTRGQSQYMSAGTGVTHSEMNYAKTVLRFMQI
jgi:redox-sensitive bicupin YhaK (pirin superfamily)